MIVEYIRVDCRATGRTRLQGTRVVHTQSRAVKRCWRRKRNEAVAVAWSTRAEKWESYVG